MVEIKLLGRGGQGAYMSAEMLAAAFVKEGKYATCFPMFGGERRGAPVNVFVRFDNKPIRLKSQIYYPDCCIITDPVLSKLPDALKGLKLGGIVVMNQPSFPDERVHPHAAIVATLDATGIALAEMGRPITNTVMLGAFVKATGWLSLETILQVMGEYFNPKLLDGNLRCARRGFEETKIQRYEGNE